MGVEDGVREGGAAVGVEHDVGGGYTAVGEAGAVEVVEGFGEWAQEGDELAVRERSAAAE